MFIVAVVMEALVCVSECEECLGAATQWIPYLAIYLRYLVGRGVKGDGGGLQGVI